MKNLYLYSTLIVLINLLFLHSSMAQNATQRIKGYVIDSETNREISNATIQLKQGEMIKRMVRTDEQGFFEIDGVSFGDYTISFRRSGYGIYITDIEVKSGKELDLGKIQLEEIVSEIDDTEKVNNIYLVSRYGDPLNELARVSARAFSVEETGRYPGSRGDVARMAANFSGIVNANDTRNDLNVRGNTPFGILWRMEGVNIPNPNHFSTMGTKGGGLTIINNKYLANSDFFTGAFPAEYSNSIGGVFDLKMRNGNREQLETSVEIGLLGAEATIERNIGSAASFLAVGRMSLFGRLENVGGGNSFLSDLKLYKPFIEFPPKYIDGAFRLHIPIENSEAIERSSLSFWGIGGQNSVDIRISSRDVVPEIPGRYGHNNRDQYLNTSMYVLGLTYENVIDTNTLLKITLAHSNINNESSLHFFDRDIRDTVINGNPTWAYTNNNPERERINDYYLNENKFSAYLMLTHKISKKTTLYNGFNIDLMYLTYMDSTRTMTSPTSIADLGDWSNRWYINTETEGINRRPILFQPHFQFKHQFNNRFIMTGGLTNVSFNINNIKSPWEPRLGFSYKMKNNQQVNMGMGVHTQTLPNYLYYYAPNDSSGYTNRDVGNMINRQIVFGYDRYFGKKLKTRIEFYYQALDNLPGKINSPTFSLINKGADYFRIFEDSLVNNGSGRNYGIDFTIEKFFNGKNYLLITGSIFDARYGNGSNPLEFNTTFNTNYILNILGGWEFELKNNRNSINLGGKITVTKGRRYGDVNYTATIQDGIVNYLDNDNFNKNQFGAKIWNVDFPDFIGYLRLDFRIGFISNQDNLSHEISLDAVNILRIQNELFHFYHPDLGKAHEDIERSIVANTQLSFIPIVYYRVNFSRNRVKYK